MRRTSSVRRVDAGADDGVAAGLVAAPDDLVAAGLVAAGLVAAGELVAVGELVAAGLVAAGELVDRALAGIVSTAYANR
jgi:hypothetical protein